MGEEFLRLVARAYVNHGMPFGKTLFVFPNRRSMKFFQKYLGEEYGKLYNKPLFSPDMLTISELFSDLSGMRIVDPIEAQYILYRNYISLKYPDESFEAAAERETFDEFLHWGNLIISDFNDIDKYLIDPKQLFSNIYDLKQLDGDYSFLSERQREAVEMFWRHFLKGGSNFKKESFISLWSIMYPLYEAFRKELEEKGLGYEGMIYRKVAANPSDNGYHRMVFIGFNAPNKCERALMKWLKEQGKGDFYWDFYGPMVTDPQNKASMFISEAVKEFPSKYRIECGFAMPKINVISVPSAVGQAFVAADILKGIGAADPIKSAVVLPDESLLMPVLNSIPESFGTVNVTMGFPIGSTPLVSFVGCISSLQKNVRVKDGKGSFYHADISSLLKHEYIKKYAPQDAANVLKTIVKENLIYIPDDNKVFGAVESPLLKAVFNVPTDTGALLEYLAIVLKELDLVADTLNKEFIYRYYQEIERLVRLELPVSKDTCLRLLAQFTSSITIPFKGEPLAGLQVIGSLEVRALDFENIIILSVNEGKFPSSSQGNSLIPYNLRVGFGLPTYELQDAIAAYHFYRSICRAKNVWLLYDTRSEGVKSGEVSRFVKQLEYHYNVPLEKSAVSAVPVLDECTNEISVVKNEAVMAKLYSRFVEEGSSKTLSASAINTYLMCPLQFYLQHVEGIKDENEVEENIEAGTFGTIFHDTMEELYSPYVGEVVSGEILDMIIHDTKRLDEVLVRMFAKSKIMEIAGQNIIIKEVIKKYVLITLHQDKKFAPFVYMAGEETFYDDFELENGAKVRFQAVIDRIDISNDKLRVIDYKTGNVTVPGGDVPVSDFFLRDQSKQYKAFVQLYLYALILSRLADSNGAIKLKNGKRIRVEISGDSTNLDLVVYPVTSLKKNSVVCEPIFKEKLDEYQQALKGCVEEIFNSEVPFVQADANSSVCGYCMFKQICGR